MKKIGTTSYQKDRHIETYIPPNLFLQRVEKMAIQNTDNLLQISLSQFFHSIKYSK